MDEQNKKMLANTELAEKIKGNIAYLFSQHKNVPDTDLDTLAHKISFQSKMDVEEVKSIIKEVKGNKLFVEQFEEGLSDKMLKEIENWYKQLNSSNT